MQRRRQRLRFELRVLRRIAEGLENTSRQEGSDQAHPSQMGITPLAWMARSWVAMGNPWLCAVATINRSAGSPWKLCGN
jgi:hypothetical protein